MDKDIKESLTRTAMRYWRRSGGHFHAALGDAMYYADKKNLDRIFEAFESDIIEAARVAFDEQQEIK